MVCVNHGSCRSRKESLPRPRATGNWCLQTPGSRLVLRKIPATVHDSLLQLVAPGVPWAACQHGSRSGQTTVALAGFFFHVQRLLGRGLVHITACADSHRLATLIPTGHHFALAWNEISDCSYILSRFAFLRRSEANTVLESPLSAARIVLHDRRAMALACALMTPATIPDIFRYVPDLSVEAVSDLVSLFLGAGMLAGDRASTGLPRRKRTSACSPGSFTTCCFMLAAGKEGMMGRWGTLIVSSARWSRCPQSNQLRIRNQSNCFVPIRIGSRKTILPWHGLWTSAARSAPTQPSR